MQSVSKSLHTPVETKRFRDLKKQRPECKNHCARIYDSLEINSSKQDF